MAPKICICCSLPTVTNNLFYVVVCIAVNIFVLLLHFFCETAYKLQHIY